MAQEQKLQTPLVESKIHVEPATPPGMGINTRIQRAWSMLFGRRDHVLQPIYGSPAGMLGVVNLDLNGWTLAYTGAPAENTWTDMAQLVDLVIYGGVNNNNLVPLMQFGPATGNIQYAEVPANVTKGFDAAGTFIFTAGIFHAQVRWYRGIEMFNVSSRVCGYTAPER